MRAKNLARVAPSLVEGPEPEARALATWYETQWAWDAVRPDDLAWALSYALGPGTYVTLDTTAKRHTVVPETAWALPSFSAEEVVATGWHDRYIGGMMKRLRLSGRTDLAPYGIAMTAELLFRGRSEGSGSGNAIAGEPVWRFDQSHVWIGSAYGGTSVLGQANVTGATEWTERWVGFGASFDNQLDVARTVDFDGGTVARAERGARGYDLRASFEMSDRTLVDDLTDGTARAVEIGWAGGVLAGATTQEFGLHLLWPHTVIADATTGDGPDGRLTVDVVWQVLSDPTYGPFVGVIWNQTAPYAG